MPLLLVLNDLVGCGCGSCCHPHAEPGPANDAPSVYDASEGVAHGHGADENEPTMERLPFAETQQVWVSPAVWEPGTGDDASMVVPHSGHTRSTWLHLLLMA